MASWFKKNTGKISTGSGLSAVACAVVDGLIPPVGIVFVAVIVVGGICAGVATVAGYKVFSDENDEEYQTESQQLLSDEVSPSTPAQSSQPSAQSSTVKRTQDLHKENNQQLAIQRQRALAFAQQTQLEQPNSQKAFNEYIKAARKNSREALPALERMAPTMGYGELMELSNVYRQQFKDFSKAEHWQKQAEELRTLQNSISQSL